MTTVKLFSATSESEQTQHEEESVHNVFTEDIVMEDLDEEEKLRIFDRFAKGEIYIVQADVAPVGDTIVRLSELDSKSSSGDADFYYDTENDIVICHNKRAK